MLSRILGKISVVAALLLCVGVNASAQAYTSYAPYSIYGIGDISQPGNAYNKTMGGVGIATRNNRMINIVNPAAVTARDSLAFMADFSLYGDNKIFSQGDIKSVSNTFNLGSLVMTFPIYRHSAFMVGIIPYSGIGYGYQYEYGDPNVIGKTGAVTYSAGGQGAIYQAMLGAGVTLFKRLSLGAQALYYFGTTEKEYYGTFSDSSYSGIHNGYDFTLNTFSGKFGLQYEQPVGKTGTLGFGATYKLGTKMDGNLESFSLSAASAATDTLLYKQENLAGKVRMAGEVGVGLSYKQNNRWSVEANYTYSDWRGCGFDSVPGMRGNTSTSSGVSAFSAAVSQSFRFGFEFTPNRNDIRYYMRRVTYRGGAYYKQDYFKVDGQDINAMGITFGATFPVYQGYNGITLGVDIGQRGSLTGQLIRERYINFSIAFNLFDIWFRKLQYE